MPSFYLADLGDMSFTLGLSGWTTNNWSQAGNFDLLAPRADVDNDTKQRVFMALKENWFESPDSLASRLGLDRSVVMGALAAYTQAGRAIWDLKKNVYRARELSREPLPLNELRFSNEREQSASRFVEANQVTITAHNPGDAGSFEIQGTVTDGKDFETSLRIGADQQIIEGRCTCNFFQQNKMRQGPCEHMLGVRIKHNQTANKNMFARLLS